MLERFVTSETMIIKIQKWLPESCLLLAWHHLSFSELLQSLHVLTNSEIPFAKIKIYYHLIYVHIRY